MRILKHKNQHL